MIDLKPLTREQLEPRIEDLCNRVKYGPRWRDENPISLYGGDDKKPRSVKEIERLTAWKIEAEKKHAQHAANLVGYAWGAEWPAE